MSSQEVYNEMIKIRRQKNNAMNSRKNYENFSEKLEKLIKELSEITENFNMLLLNPQGLVIDSQPVSDNKINALKKNIETIISRLKNEVRIEINTKIKKIDSEIFSLDKKYKILSNQYQNLLE